MHVPPPRQATAPGQALPPESPAQAENAQAENWHRYHYPIGIFLTLYGLTGLLSALIGWSGHRKEIAGYLTKTAGLDAGPATPVLAGLHVVEALLILIGLAGLLRRRDVWFLPVIFGWMAGFAVFCVLDVWAGTMGLLAEHGVYLVGFTVLLFVSYALGVKVRVGQAPSPDRQRGQPARNLSRTQEIALSALNRWQRAAPPGHVQAPPGAQPGPGPEYPPPPSPPAPAATPTAGPPPPTAPAPALAPTPTSAPAPALAPTPTSAPVPVPQGQQQAPLPPPRRFRVTPPGQRPPES
jgi:hypothetical protein